MAELLENPLATMAARDLRELWQGRALAAATGTTAAVLLSVLAHNYDPEWIVLANVVRPITWDAVRQGVRLPALSTAARIAKDGTIVADVTQRNGRVKKRAVLYENELALRDDFRRLADQLKFNDADRTEMFKAVQRWVVADMRLDPNFDPKDPDAKRLVH